MDVHIIPAVSCAFDPEVMQGACSLLFFLSLLAGSHYSSSPFFLYRGHYLTERDLMNSSRSVVINRLELVGWLELAFECNEQQLTADDASDAVAAVCAHALGISCQCGIFCRQKSNPETSKQQD